MHSYPKSLSLLLAVSLLLVSGSTEIGHAEQGKSGKAKPPQGGFRVESVEQENTETISWLRIQVAADTGLGETWAVLQNIEEWAEFLDIFSRVTPVEKTETMTRYWFSVSAPWPVPDFDSVVWIATLPDQRVMLWRKHKERMTSSHGKIAVKEIPGGSRVIYEIHTPAEKAFPPWVVRIGLYLVLPGMARDFYDRIQQQD
jgi:hypothetical protein